MTKKAWVLSVAAAMLLFIFLLLFSAPAKLIQPVLEANLPQLVVTNPKGTIWRGRSAQAWVNFPPDSIGLGEVSWQLDPWSLFKLAPKIEVRAQPAQRPLSAQIEIDSSGAIGVRDLSADLPLTLFKPWLVPPSGMDLLMDGMLHIDIERLEIDAQGVRDVLGQLQLTQARWTAGSFQLALGDYRADLSMQDDVLLIAMRDVDAALGVDGKITLDRQTKYQFDARISARESLPPDVLQVMALFGRRISETEVQVTTRGQLNSRAEQTDQ